MITLERLTSLQNPYWQQVTSLYTDTFPEWEREPIKAIETHIADADSFCVVAIENTRVVGAYICDVDRDLKFLLLSYVFVDDKHRGKGIGKRLCAHLKAFQEEHSTDFNWLLLETEDFNLSFYFSLGYRKVAIEYLSPHYDSEKSTPMSLMLAHQEDKVPLTQSTLRQIITSMFIDGYGLSDQSKRLVAQLEKVPENVKLLTE